MLEEKIKKDKKRESMQRSLVIEFLIYISVLILIFVFIFYVFVHVAVSNKLLEININSNADINELLAITRRSIGITIATLIISNVVLIYVANKKLVHPIKQITEATQKVSSGDFNVQLETKRKDEIGELTNNFNKMVKDLRSIECLQKDFIDNVSHEVKTPISSIQGFAQLLKDETISAKERDEYSDIIVEESNRLLKLSTNILKISKLQNQENITKREKINITEQIRKIISLLEPKWREKNIKFELSGDKTFIYGDEELIYQIWLNLIENAIKFSNNGGNIDIEIKRKDDLIIIKIKDYGIGMSEEQSKKIFEKFYQIDKSRTGEGSGLGLSIVKRIVELSKGEIEVESTENKGTTFIVKLPVNDEKNKVFVI